VVDKDERRITGGKSTYKKLAVQWLNAALCFVSNFLVADSLVLRNRQLVLTAKRQAMKKPAPRSIHENHQCYANVSDFTALLREK
jgi:hypothetical protein